MRAIAIILCLSASSLALTGCNTPRGIGNSGQILKDAGKQDADFEVYPVSRSTVGVIRSWPGQPAPTATSGWLPNTRGPASNLIQPGDKLDLTIWEGDSVTLLSAPGQKMISLQNITVSSDGSIFLPYADRVYVANMTPERAREAIQQKMEAFVPSSQVLVAHSPGRKSSVDLVSGVVRPGTIPLPDRDFTVLSLIAAGGGIAPGIQNPYVRLIRGNKLYGISAERLLKNPALDTTLRGGDKVFVEPDERYFIALGASGRESQVPFTKETLSALDALSMSGGLNDARADAKGILVLRDYPTSALRQDGKGPRKNRVIFAIDLTTADGLFSAGQFQMQNKDVLVATESPINTAQSVMSVLGAVLGLGRTVQLLSDSE